MILNNYWIWKAYIEKHTMGNGGNASMDIGLINTTGNTANFCYSAANNGYMNTHTGLIYNWTIKRALSAFIGSGDTAVQATDYTLATNITSSFTNVSVVASTSADGNSEKTVITISGANTSGDAVTIKEIGVYAQVCSGVNATPVSDVLLTRDVLETPIEVANGQSFTITFTWEES